MGKDYIFSVTASLKGVIMDIDEAEFDLRASLENPNFRISEDNRLEWREYVAHVEEKLQKIKSLARL